MKLVKEFEKKYQREEEEEVRWQEAKEDKKVFSRELPGRYIAKMLYVVNISCDNLSPHSKSELTKRTH